MNTQNNKKKRPAKGMTRCEVDKLLKSSHLVSSFVGDAYIEKYKSLISEIEEQHRRNAQKLAMNDKAIGKALIRKRYNNNRS